ncbi:hypothetical protein [Brachyspira pulli]|uniref:hypothetical protein n=1 Tax=Brachyspira pulli TaxID=310721 RepID=UPI003007BD4E
MQNIINFFNTENYEYISNNFSILFNHNNNEIHLYFEGFTKDDYFDLEKLKSLIDNLDIIVNKAREIIKENSNEYIKKDMVDFFGFNDIIIYKDDTFNIGFDIGDPPIGELYYIYIKFDWNFNASKDIIYECYK